MAAFIRGNFFIPDARKGWNYYAKRAAEKILQSEGIKKVITTGPPHSTHLVGSFLKTNYGIQWWADFRDPWVDIFYNQQLYRSYFAKRIDAYLEKKVLRNADGILTTVGGNLIKKFKIKAPDQSFHVLPNGYDAAMMSAVSRTTVNPFHVVYTGLLTENQDYIPVIKALSALSENGKVLFSLAGNISAAQIDKIKQLAPKVTVEYKGYLSHRDAVGLMKSGDLLLNFIFKGADQDMVSGKLLEYLACGVPVLSIGAPQSEAGRLLAGSSFSKMVKASDSDAIKSFLLKAFQNKGKLVNEFPALKKWSRQALTVDLATVLMKES
jgi:glycosyltransferase involved in cell wall biosynthesis